MVKKYSELYLECRRALLSQEDAQSAGMMARNLLAHYAGRTQEYIQSLKRYSSSGSRGIKKGGRSTYKASTKTINVLERNIINIANLRLCLVQIAQNKFYKE